MPKVSVIMSVYNGSQFLGRAIQSILAQTEKDFEFIIIDDGSTEPVYKIINSFSDPRIRHIGDQINKGLTIRLNECLELVKGDFIVRMDGDDISLPTRIENQIAAFEDGVGFTGCWGRSIDANGKSIIHFVDRNCRGTSQDLINKYPTKLCMIDASSVYSKEAVNKVGFFDKRMYRTQTYNYNRRLQLLGFSGKVVEEILYVRTVHAGSVMRRSDPSVDLVKLANKYAVEKTIIKEL